MIKIQQKNNFNSISEFHIFQNKQLGTGSFGIVNLSIHIKTCKLYAIKIINLKKLSSSSEMKIIEKENKIHAMLDHPHIVKLWDNIVEEDKLYMIMQYVQRGSLFSYQNTCTKFPQIQAFKYFYQTLNALKYIHDHNIIHRDLKPENLLLDSDLNIKLCDFGWATNCLINKRNTFCGTYQYMAPEIIFEKQYDHRTDIWSLGVLLYQLLHGYAPFRGENAIEIKNRMKIGKYNINNDVSEDCKLVIMGILKFQPEERMTLHEIQINEWTIKMQKSMRLNYVQNQYYNIQKLNIPQMQKNMSVGLKELKSLEKKKSVSKLSISKNLQYHSSKKNTKPQNIYTDEDNTNINININTSIQNENSLNFYKKKQMLGDQNKLYTSATLKTINFDSIKHQILENLQVNDNEGVQTPGKVQLLDYNEINTVRHKKSLKKSKQKYVNLMNYERLQASTEKSILYQQNIEQQSVNDQITKRISNNAHEISQNGIKSPVIKKKGKALDNDKIMIDSSYKKYNVNNHSKKKKEVKSVKNLTPIGNKNKKSGTYPTNTKQFTIYTKQRKQYARSKPKQKEFQKQRQKEKSKDKQQKSSKDKSKSKSKSKQVVKIKNIKAKANLLRYASQPAFHPMPKKK